MITLNRKLKKDHAPVEPTNGLTTNESVVRRISVRDKLLIKEVQEMNENLPATCSVYFEDPNVLSEFILTVAPDEGYWLGGKFKFSVFVTEDYNMAVSILNTILCNASGLKTSLNTLLSLLKLSK